MWWILHKPSGQFMSMHGPTSMNLAGYESRSRIITAMKSSGILWKRGISWDSLELVNEAGHTMQEMIDWPVEEGYAIQHTEGWYWQHPTSLRVWYKRPQDAETAWKQWDAEHRAVRGMRPRTTWVRSGIRMVRGFSDGSVSVMENWLI